MLYQLSYAHHIAMLEPDSPMAHPAGLEPATIRLEGGCSIQLSYGRLIICEQTLKLQLQSSLTAAFLPSDWLCSTSGANLIEPPHMRQHEFQKIS